MSMCYGDRDLRRRECTVKPSLASSSCLANQTCTEQCQIQVIQSRFGEAGSTNFFPHLCSMSKVWPRLPVEGRPSPTLPYRLNQHVGPQTGVDVTHMHKRVFRGARNLKQHCADGEMSVVDNRATPIRRTRSCGEICRHSYFRSR